MAELEGDKSIDVLFVCDRGFAPQARGIMSNVSVPVAVRTVTSGKLRRYPHLSFWQHFAHISIVGSNLVDMFKVAIGFFQSLVLIAQFRPDVVLAKGGFVCLPVGFAAWCLRRPLVIHDSDARPGLTARLLVRFATTIATGFPLKNYTYPSAKSHYVGVPIDQAYSPVSAEEQAAYKQALGYDPTKPMLMAFGGGLGSVNINDAAADLARALGDGVTVYNGTGTAHVERAEQRGAGLMNYHPEGFVYGLHDIMAAADLVITRASATALQELAGMSKPTIAVPGRQLADQHYNAKIFGAADAVVVLQDDELATGDRLTTTVRELLDSPDRRDALAQSFHTFAKPDAALQLAKLVIAAAKS